MPVASGNVSIVVIAGLLSLLPVTLLFWAYYLRERAPSVPGPIVTRFFVVGMLAVAPAFFIERLVFRATYLLPPEFADALFSDVVVLDTARDLFFALLTAFALVALVEEGIRFVLLGVLFRRHQILDQIVDGIQVGVASGIGFAFIENALYFLRLFQRLDFDTLAVVFFLRFLVSTFGHMSFGGIMGYELARAIADPVDRRRHFRRAFLLPWALHGLFDAFLSIQLSAYAILFLFLPLSYLWTLYRSPKLHERFRLHGRVLRAPIAGGERPRLSWRRPPVEQLPMIPWCPTCLHPLPSESPHGKKTAGRVQPVCRHCGTRFYRKSLPPTLTGPAFRTG